MINYFIIFILGLTISSNGQAFSLSFKGNSVPCNIEYTKNNNFLIGSYEEVDIGNYKSYVSVIYQVNMVGQIIDQFVYSSSSSLSKGNVPASKFKNFYLLDSSSLLATGWVKDSVDRNHIYLLKLGISKSRIEKLIDVTFDGMDGWDVKKIVSDDQNYYGICGTYGNRKNYKATMILTDTLCNKIRQSIYNKIPSNSICQTFTYSKKLEFYLAGAHGDGAYPDSRGKCKFLFLKTNRDGEILNKLLELPKQSTKFHSAAYHIVNNGNHHIITGTIDSNVFLLKTDMDCNNYDNKWPKIYSDEIDGFWKEGHRIEVHTINNKEYIFISGYTQRKQNSDNDIFLLCVDKNGNVVSKYPKYFGGKGEDGVVRDEILVTMSSHMHKNKLDIYLLGSSIGSAWSKKNITSVVFKHSVFFSDLYKTKL